MSPGILACTLAIALVPPALCERLSMRVYSTAEGLAHDHVSRIRHDSRGFVWFCTDGGLSKWDGYGFKSYTTSDGLPHVHVDDFLETRRGEVWVATDAGVARFHPEQRTAPFTTYFPGVSSLSRAVNVLLEDQDGTVLLGTGDGLYRLEHAGAEVRITPEQAGFPADEHDGALVNTLLLAHDGRVWAGTGSGIYTRSRDGHWRRFYTSNGRPADFINQLREDSKGRIWAGTRGGGLLQLEGTPGGSGPFVARRFTKADGLPGNDVRDLLISGDGHIWAGTSNGLAEATLAGSRSKARFRSHSIIGGLADQSVYGISMDSAGDVWLATGQAGAIRLPRQGFHTYMETDGFLPQEANQIIETREGHLCVIGGDHSRRLVQCFADERFTHEALPPSRQLRFGFEWRQFGLQDRSGQWWFATERGALRTPDLKRRTAPGQGEFVAGPAMSTGLWHLFEDSRGVIWMAGENADSSAIATWESRTRNIRVLWRRFFVTARKRTSPSCFVEDASGQIWVGLTGEGGILRWRSDHFDSFGREDGVPAGEITDLYRDHSGHIWIASSEGGIAAVSNPGGARPYIRNYSRASGLSSNEIWCIAEDGAGRIYAGTGRGVDAVDPATGHVMHYTADDGLIPGPVRACFLDHAGDLWFATNRGISRWTAARESPVELPRAFITELRVRGAASSVWRVGVSQAGPVALDSSENQVAIDFVGVDNRFRGDLRYQYRLLGADTTWSEPVPERTVTFATLAPGRYQFEVRALSLNGGLSLPAVVVFKIRPPVWQRWWFRLVLLFGGLGILYWLHRYRTLRLLELERMRTRIATDLHDDIGSGLSQIAVLAEVARMGVSDSAPDLKGALSHIGSVSRELAESMSDIVWSVNPRRDHVSDLLQRMRRFSSDLLTGGSVDFTFRASIPDHPVTISAAVRREVYLIFKEAVNNVVRHSRCTRAGIVVSIDRKRLDLMIEDDGVGHHTRMNEGGNGLRNMEERARRIGARIEFGSGEYAGTRVILRVLVRGSLLNELPEQVAKLPRLLNILLRIHGTGLRRTGVEGRDH